MYLTIENFKIGFEIGTILLCGINRHALKVSITLSELMDMINSISSFQFF